jgi:hypothetical protein
MAATNPELSEEGRRAAQRIVERDRGTDLAAIARALLQSDDEGNREANE